MCNRRTYAATICVRLTFGSNGSTDAFREMLGRNLEDVWAERGSSIRQWAGKYPVLLVVAFVLPFHPFLVLF